MDRVREAMILAGGLGTRLRPLVAEVPKVLAPIQGVPFLQYLLAYLYQQGVQRVILSLGYMAEKVTEWLALRAWPFQVVPCIEPEPLGTGGAIAYAFSFAEAQTVAVFNGDTFFPIDLAGFGAFHRQESVPLSIALAQVSPADRYGVVEVAHKRVQAFREKQPRPEGWIYGGVALIERAWWQAQPWPDKFSWEEYLMQAVPTLPVGAFLAEGVPFLDIGVPKDYQRAQFLIPQYAHL